MRSFTFLAGLAMLTAAARADLHYTVTPDVPAASVKVSLTLDSAGDKVFYQIPAWAPGFYFIMKFEDKISDFAAVGVGGESLSVKHEERQWVVENPKRGPITINYRVLGDDKGLGFFGTHVDEHTGFINGPSAFIYPTGRLDEPCRLRVNLPSGWQLATPMDSDGSGYIARSGYDEFVDQPIQMGKFVREEVMVGSMPMSIIFVAGADNVECDTKVESKRIAQESKPALDLFGGASFKHYYYFLHLAVGDFDGGLEHRSSNVIAVPNMAELKLDELGTHEYFHAWNVKQIRPNVLGPFDYTQPVRTNNLWFSEGVTDYYAFITAHRSGVPPEGWLLDKFGSSIAELQSGSTRKKVTLEECSQRAWENGVGVVGDMSYYNKGLVCGLVFDAKIRAVTRGSSSLDDVMRLLYKRHKLPSAGFAEDELRKTINEVAHRDLSALYNRMVRSTGELPYDELKSIGLRLYSPDEAQPSLGFQTIGQVVTEVGDGAKKAGLQKDDRILRVAGRFFQRAGSLAGISGSYKAEVERDGRKMMLTLRVSKEKPDNYTLDVDPYADATARRLLGQWLAR